MSTRPRTLAKAKTLLPPGTTIYASAYAHAPFRMNATAKALAALFIILFLIGLFNGQVLLPGAILLYIFIRNALPQRSVVVAAEGVAVFSTSAFSTKPKTLLVTDSLNSLRPTPKGMLIQLNVGSETILLSKREYKRLTAALPPAPKLSATHS